MRLMNFPNFLIAMAPNFLMVFLLALLLNYPYPQQMTEADFADMDPRYENCTILSEQIKDEMHYYLVQTHSAQMDLIPSKQHSAFPSRWKIYKRQITPIEDIRKDITLELRVGMQTNTVSLSNGQIQIQHTGLLHHANADHGIYAVIAGLLSIVELFILDKIFGHT